jgi:hypothetical protein
MSLSYAGFVLATDQSSPNFQNKDATFAPAVFNESSPNFQINGSVDSIVGSADSPNFTVKSGVPLNDGGAAPIPPPPSGGGGGGLSAGSGSGTGSLPPPSSTVPSPTLSFHSPTFKSHQVIGGSRDASTSVLVNGSENGVTYPDSTHWLFDLPLFLGLDDIRVEARSSSGSYSFPYGGTIERMLIGDVNKNHIVDDVDLSLFTRAWKKFNFFADFNEDGRIDDADLSLLASHWGLRY